MNKRARIVTTLCLLGSAAIAVACTIHKYEQPPPAATNTAAPAPAPTPTPAPTDTSTAPAPVAYDPCAGKKCGDGCSVCDPNDKSCVETAVVKQCSIALKCEASPAQCTTPTTAEYNSCAGKRCGERCTLCKPGDLKCRESPLVKLCHADGHCKEATVADCANK